MHAVSQVEEALYKLQYSLASCKLNPTSVQGHHAQQQNPCINSSHIHDISFNISSKTTMAKFTMASTTLLLVVVVLAMADLSSAIRSIIIEEEGWMNPAGKVKPGKCAKRMMKPEVHMLSQCQLYIGDMMQKGSTNYPGQRQDETLDMCCQQLAGMDEKCRCEGLKMAVKLQMQKEQRRALESGEGMEDVEDAEEEKTEETGEKTEEEKTEEVQRRVKEMMMEEKMMHAAEKMYSKCNLTPCSCYMSRAE